MRYLTMIITAKKIIPDNIKHYIKVIRIDHWFKNVFILPGFVAAIFMRGYVNIYDFANIALAFILTSFVASVNYIINEILDAPYDALHPKKRYRPIPSGLVKIPALLFIAFGFLAATTIITTLQFNLKFIYSLGALLIMGLVYNIPPIRTKEIPYLDVISESANNPIRFLIGWYSLGVATLPPSSTLFAYWSLGAFLMTSKRFAEFRFINNPTNAAQYRRSFQYYSEESLLIAMIVYISLFMFLYGVFAVKHRIELLIAWPLFLIFIAWFFHIAFQKNSIVSEPERVLRKPFFLIFCIFTFLLAIILMKFDIEPLSSWLLYPFR